MPPVGTDHVVTTHAVARMLGWSAARVRSIDDVLKPTRVSDESRLFDVDRVLFLVHTMDVMHSLPPLRLVRISKTAPRREGDFERYGTLYRITREPLDTLAARASLRLGRAKGRTRCGTSRRAA